MSHDPDDVDVLVIGGGMAGLTAAVRSIRSGARMLVVEATNGADIGGLYHRAYAGGIAPAVVFGLAAADRAAGGADYGCLVVTNRRDESSRN